MARKDPISHLVRHPAPSPTLVREILAVGTTAVPRLCALAANRAGWAPEGTPHNNAARGAIFVLRRIGDPAAIPTLVEVLTEAPADSAVVRSAAWALPGFGAAVIEPVLPHATEGSRWIEATEVLAECGVHDERIAQRILALIATVPAVGADAARAYGDPSLAGPLQAAFDAACPPGEPTGDDIQLAADLATSIVELGVADEARVHRVQAMLDRFKAVAAGKQEELAELRARLDVLDAAGIDVTTDAVRNRVAAEVVRRRT
jgi:HEAT repeat protein